MLFRFLDHIRRQSTAVREQYAFWLTVGIVGCIGLVWLAFLPHRFMAADNSDFKVEADQPFSQLMQQFQANESPTPALPSSNTTAEPAATTSRSQPFQLELSGETLDQISSQSTSSAAVEPASTERQGSGRTVLIATSSTSSAPVAD